MADTSWRRSVRGLDDRLVLVAAFALLLPATAWAYLDPGAGSILLQTLVAGALAVLYAVKVFWRDLRRSAASFLRRLKRRDH